MSKFIPLLAIGLCLSIWAQAQQTISGTVTSFTDGMPLPGVSVVVKGTSRGTVTNTEGRYQLGLEPTDKVLVFSFVGMTTEEESINGRSQLNVALTEDLEQLSEVVVVGYGTQERKLITGSVSQVKAEAFENNVAGSLEGALQGRVAGVQINANSGTPGGGLSIQVRGGSSLTGGSQPLYVVDGIPVTTGNKGQIGYEGQGINALSDLNPDDIESVTVLKDAASAAIYGARSANGVVLITTKSGTANKTRINLEAFTGYQRVYKKLDLLDATEFKQYMNDVALSEGGSPVYGEEDIAATGAGTNWLDEVMRTAPVSNIDLSISGGSETTRYYVSGSLWDEVGTLLGTDYRRYNGRLNLDHEINKRVRFGIKTGNTFSINNRVPGDQTIDGVLPNAISKPPILAIRDAESGEYLEQGFWPNPVAIGNEALNQARVFRNISTLYGEWDIVPQLTFRNQWGVDFYNLSEIRYEPTTTRRGRQSNGIGIAAETDVLKLVQQSTLNYQASLGTLHNLEALVGWSYEVDRENTSYIRGSDFPSNMLKYLGSAGVIEPDVTGANLIERGLNSYFGRINYNFNQRYLLTFNLRFDGSSRFSDSNKYGVFPGVSAGWVISEENFLKNSNTFSNLKLRAGYGFTGNDDIIRDGFMSLYSGGYNYRGSAGLISTQIPNPDLRWEKTANANLGLDAGFYQDRLSLTADFYYYKTTDLLQNTPLPGTSGFSFVAQNIGSLENKGLELGLSAVIYEKQDFRWNTDFNISFNRNKVLSLYNDQPILNQGRGNNAAIVGEPLGVFYMLQSLGVDPSTGELVFADANYDGVITDADRQVVGNPNPEFFGGITNTLSYKNFDLSLFIQFVYGNDIYNGVRQYGENMTFGDSDNQLTSISQRWRQPGDRAPVPRINGQYNNDITSHYLEDGSFIRFRNLSLGYNLPSSWIERAHMRSARVYVRTQNLFTFTNYSGMDPDVNYAGASALRMGTDFFTYPQPRTITFGLKVGF